MAKKVKVKVGGEKLEVEKPVANVLREGRTVPETDALAHVKRPKTAGKARRPEDLDAERVDPKEGTRYMRAVAGEDKTRRVQAVSSRRNRRTDSIDRLARTPQVAYDPRVGDEPEMEVEVEIPADLSEAVEEMRSRKLGALAQMLELASVLPPGDDLRRAAMVRVCEHLKLEVEEMEFGTAFMLAALERRVKEHNEQQ